MDGNTSEQCAPVVTKASCARGSIAKSTASMSGEMVIPFYPAAARLYLTHRIQF